MKKSTGRKNKEVLARHRVVTGILRPFLALAIKLFTGARCDSFTAVKGEPYFVIYNHLTGWDQFFCGLSMKAPLYYVAMDDIFRHWYGPALKWLINPVPFKKSARDAGAVKKCIRIAREGGSICVSPEGNRSYDGELAFIKPSVVKLIRSLRLPVAFFAIEGGYGFNPRWSAKNRKGRVHCYVSSVLRPEVYADMTDEELYSYILEHLKVPQCRPDSSYTSSRSAEYLERLIYYCPACGKSEFVSRGAELTCQNCGLTVEYGSDLKLTLKSEPEGCSDFDFRYTTVADWYEDQNRYVEGFDLEKWGGEPVYEEEAQLLDATGGSIKALMKGTLRLYTDRLEISDGSEKMTIRLCEVKDAAIVAKKKFSLYVENRVYQLRAGDRFNSIKYVNMIYHYKNVTERMQYTYDSREFLGL